MGVDNRLRTDIRQSDAQGASALTAQAAAAPAGGTGATAGAYDTAVNRDAAIAAINNNRTRIAELETALKAAGILPA